jgi:hypothetical protein
MKSLESLEKKLNIASSLIDELEIDNYDIIPSNSITNLPEITKVDEKGDEVFSLETLKSDFMMIRQNVMKLISTGQRILDTASLIDVSDMKASQLTALSQLQQTLGNNLKLMVDCYREISEIEKIRLCATGKVTEAGATQVNTANTVNNTIVFSGDTNSLLDIIKQNQLT